MAMSFSHSLARDGHTFACFAKQTVSAKYRVVHGRAGVVGAASSCQPGAGHDADAAGGGAVAVRSCIPAPHPAALMVYARSADQCCALEVPWGANTAVLL